MGIGLNCMAGYGRGKSGVYTPGVSQEEDKWGISAEKVVAIPRMRSQKRSSGV